jgi:hypothetical protein
MKLTELMVDTKSAWIDFPGCPGFQVQVANLSRKELVALRKRCITQKFDRKTRQMMEELDEDKFVTEFSKATIKGWKGFKLKYLEDLILVDLKNQDPEEELVYDQEQSEVLVSNSSEFDNWINEVVFDLANFRGRSDRDAVGKTGEMAKE